jgi:hypothetical protein
MAEFKISTNIERDAKTELDYIVTKNSNEVYNRIIHNYSRGQNSFSIIGSYGTGKSTFLWAFEHHLNGDVKFENPVNGEFKEVKKFSFTRIVGDSSSFKERFCDAFGLNKFAKKSNKAILKEFDILLSEINNQKRALILLVDEFGKHLEYIAKENPEEMYFIQELAEFCNDKSKQVLFITTLHQNFSVYSKGLTKAQKSEWDKVRGRLIDIAFDEPVEQLLFFAAQRLKAIAVPKNLKSIYTKTVKTIVDSQLLGKSLATKIDTLEELFPLDPIAADVLTKSLQRYGQNERSLFTFLESKELLEKIDKQEAFTVADCFDYLVKNLTSEIEDGEKNPFKPQWKAAVVALEKAEFLFSDNYEDASKVIKTICLINIFSSASGRLDEKVLTAYSETVMGVKNAFYLIETLSNKGVIKFSNHRSKYNFIDGTDVDIEQELIAASKYVDNDFDLVSRLESFFDFGIIPAKRIQFEKGTPRFFTFKFWSDFDFEEPENEIDGYINLIFKKRINATKVNEEVQAGPSNQVFVLFKEIDQIEETLFEIDKINHVINKYSEDKVAIRILNEEKLFRTNQLKRFVEDALFSKDARVTWIWKDEIDKGDKKRKITSYRGLNQLLSDVAEVAYPDTPTYRNEMVNKEYLSTPILTARKALLRKLIDNGDQKDLGFPENKFPPEKTIYLSLLERTGIHKKSKGAYHFDAPSDPSLIALWNKCEELLASSCESKMPISDLYNHLRSGTFKLKQGFLDFWIPIFLVIKKEDYALYYNDGEYVPHLTTEVMDIIHKNPTKYFVKALSAEGVRSDYLGFYKELVGFNESNVSGLASSYITIYGNFLKFYRSLETFSKKTKLIPQSAVDVRNAIATAKDPESALFQTIPEALGYYNLSEENKGAKLKSFLDDLQLNIRHIRSAYDNLVDQVEQSIIDHLDLKSKNFDDFKSQVSKLFKPINKNLILNDQLRVFYTRVVSPLDVKKAYWESLCDATIGKRLDKVSDDEVQLLIDRMVANFNTLIDLIDIHSLKTKDNEDIIQLSILDQSGNKNIKKSLILTEKKLIASQKLEAKFEKMLGEDNDINKIALLNLLEKALKK